MVDSGRGRRSGNIRRSVSSAAAGLLLLLAGMVLGGISRSAPLRVFFVTAGFLGLIGCVRRALAIWNVDAFVFEDFKKDLVETGWSRPRARPGRSLSLRGAASRLIGLAVLAFLLEMGFPT